MGKATKRHNKGSSSNIQTSLDKAWSVLEKGDYSKAVDLLKPLEASYPFSDNKLNDRYDSLLAYAYSQVQRILEAEQIIERGLVRRHDLTDLLFTHLFIKLALREYEAAKSVGQQYLASLDSKKSSQSAMFGESTHKGQALNMLGVANRQSGSTDMAAEFFTDSIEADSRNHLPYLNLAHLYLRENKKEKSLAILMQGQKSCGQVHEIRMLQESVTNRPSVSACMIVKDEEELLAGCLESIRDWVDEIIIVDTGSTDRTVEIAESFGAKLFHQPWEGNFSKHRNYSLEQATGDWLFVIDADERILNDDVPLLLSILAQKKHNLVSVNVFNSYGKSKDSTTFLPSTRLFRRELNLRYEGIVHNLLTIPEKAGITRADVRINHLGYDLSKEKMAAKIARSRTLLEKQLDENPDNAFALFNYAQLLRGDAEENLSGNAELILKSASRAVELTDPNNQKERHIHLMCLNQIAWTQLFAGRYDEALKFANKSLEIKQDYLDPLLLLGHIYAKKEDYPRAEKAYQNYVEAQSRYNPTTETENIIVSHVDSRVNAFYGLGMISELRGDLLSAKSHYRKTLELDALYLEANAHLGRILLQEENIAEAEISWNRQMESETLSSTAVKGLAKIYSRTSREDKAEKLFNEWLEKNPDDQPVLCSYARFCLETGRSEMVDKILGQLSDFSSTDESVSRELADIYFAQGGFARSAELLQNLITGKPTTDPAILNDLGNCHFKLGNLSEAENWYCKAAETTPLLPISFRNLGLTRARLERLDEAITDLTKYLELVPDDEEISSLLGDMLSQSGDYITTLSFYERQLSRFPNDLTALLRLSDCYLHMGHSDSAVIGYRRVLSIDPENRSARQRLASLSETVGRA